LENLSLKEEYIEQIYWKSAFQIDDQDLKNKDNEVAGISKKITRVNKQI